MLLAPIEAPEVLQLPRAGRPEQMPSLPAWVALRLRLLSDETQPDPQGKWRRVTTIPASAVVRAGEREALEQHVAALEALCIDTPDGSVEAEKAMLVVLTKLMFCAANGGAERIERGSAR